MLSSTLSDGLAQYRIGAKIRSLRLGKQLNQQQLAQHTGLSTALLSKIERGQLFPTLPTLLRIALVFGVGLEHFFIETDARPLIAVTRREDRVRLPDQPGKTPPAYLFESLDFPVTERKMEAYYAEFPPSSAPSESHRHAGTEFIYLLSGRLVVTIADEDVVLGEGDSLSFDSGAPHSYCRGGAEAATAVVVVTSAGSHADG